MCEGLWLCECVRVGEREREGQGDRGRERQGDRETEKLMDT